jgi:hypothetical protein
MLDHTDTEIATIRVPPIDDAYVAWFNAESECEKAPSLVPGHRRGARDRLRQLSSGA